MPISELYLSEKISDIKIADEELYNLYYTKPNFEQPADEKNYTTPVFNHIQNINLYEYNTLDILFGRGLNFYINGIPVLQWEKGQSIGSALYNSVLVARDAIIRRLEANFRFQAVRLGSELIQKIKENISPISNYDPLQVDNPNYEYYPSPNFDREPSIETISQNLRVSDTPDRILSTNFSSDLVKAITQLENVQSGQLEDSTFPFYFKNINNNETCFFNGYFDNISENMSANWSKMEFFGRTQGISKYISTEWTVSISFNIVPEWKTDINYIYKKLEWLKKMNYPKYNENNSYEEVPLIRFTIGNLFSDLGGYISSLSIDYDMSGNWENEKGKILPRKIMVNMDFNIIKDEMPSSETTFYDNINYDEELVYYRT